ncbi:FtsW/RodA/SpoVE family cell cycle protein [Sphingopyxis witflariensis]|uniref:Probable peptidoglycan glycosyltransferase FtsW n=1 Tax=Sphingopyxis witflariensis TaxID=173675 RepID=A0A246K3W6_9SPHN|nr:putative peptidoglycan glycosyltransferase FtsW [Sphingopyxis witflariensis]OWR00122.1 cell division protein FtsW [Sphingopyxis witflariensis]
MSGNLDNLDATPEKPVIAAQRSTKRRGPRLSRADRTPLGLWFWEIDRVLLLLVSILVAVGLVAVAAASPVAAQKLSTTTASLDPLYYFYRQLMWVILGVPVMLMVSMLPKPQARRFAIYGTLVFVVLLFLVPLVGTTVNGAQRWIGSGALRLQPSEFLKPFFAVSLAWILSLRLHDQSLPVVPLSLAFTGVIAALLMGQPDLGQTIIFAATWFVLVLVAGLSMRILAGLVGAGFAGLVLAYFFYPVAQQRINIWLFAQGDSFQVDKAHATLTAGGLVGTGPGAGLAKFQLPEAHTDYIFSVIGEEFGMIACLAIVAIYLAIIVRVLVRLLDEEDSFLILAVAGLIAQFGGQATINMAVNTQLFPSKGMTLPFISYGGSSFIALSIGMGLLLSLTRRNPYAARVSMTRNWNKK